MVEAYTGGGKMAVAVLAAATLAGVAILWYSRARLLAMWTTPFGGGGGGGGKGGGAAGRAPLVKRTDSGGDWSENWSDEEDWDGGEGGTSKVGHAR